VWYLFLFGMAVAIAFLVWDFRRKAAAREAASKQRFEEMFRARSTAAPLAAPLQAGAPAPDAAPPGAKQASPPAPAFPKGRFLGQRETLVYRLLKAGIPDHEVFANATLATVVGGKNEQETRRLAQYRLDFVVCDKAMQVVAVVEMEAAGGIQAAGEQRFKTDSLKAAGIRLVHVDAGKLPRRDEIHALVCGQPSSPASAVKE
jgi:uncharacterized protein DUF2726